MGRILCFDTSTKTCTVGLSIDGQITGLKESTDAGFRHAETLNPSIAEVMAQAEMTMDSIDAIAVGKGPGSYTGLRIGVSSAKGLAMALGIPIISIDTLKGLAAQVCADIGDDALLCPMLDARRMEVYAGFFSKDLSSVRPTSADIIDETSYTDFLADRQVHFLGDGMDKCLEVLGMHANARFISGVVPSVRSMASLAEAKYAAADFEDTAYFEPFYLKEFMATTPKKLL